MNVWDYLILGICLMYLGVALLATVMAIKIKEQEEQDIAAWLKERAE